MIKQFCDVCETELTKEDFYITNDKKDETRFAIKLYDCKKWKTEMYIYKDICKKCYKHFLSQMV